MGCSVGGGEHPFAARQGYGRRSPVRCAVPAGRTTTVSTRKDFTNLQENIFMALVAKTDIDLIKLEKGEVDESEIVKELISTMESYTNGGLILIKEKLEENPNYFLQPTSFLDMILQTNG